MRCRSAAMLAFVAFVRVAHAEPSAPKAPDQATEPSPNETNASKPEHLAQAFIQLGLAFTGEFVVAPGPICNFSNAPSCILNSGGGLTIRAGRRLRGPLYFGAAYEFTKMDSSQLYRVAILQQFRAEGRYYVFTGRTVEPWFGATVGADVYGNLWGVDTGGPLFGTSVGTEFQVSTVFTLSIALSYHALFFSSFIDPANTARPPPGDGAGFAHLVGLDLIVETRDPF